MMTDDPQVKAETDAAKALQDALVKAGYTQGIFKRGLALVPDPIKDDEKKVIEPIMQKWLAAAEEIEKAHPNHKGTNFVLHSPVSFGTREMVHNYFRNNHITVSDAVLGDEYQKMMRLFPQPKKPVQQL